MSRLPHKERHRSDRIGWLRAAVLGANDGIVSTASLLVGVAAAQVAKEPLILTGVAALVAGSLSMAAGEYVSVSSQSDTEQADLAKEAAELEAPGDHERQELAEIYVGRSLDAMLADEVARQLMEHDALGAHARDELGINEIVTARPVQAALTAAADRGVRGAILQVLDPAEEEFPFHGRTIFESMGGGIRHETQQAGDLRDRYLARLAERKDRLAELGRAVGWHVSTHHTGQPAQSALLWAFRALEGGR